MRGLSPVAASGGHSSSRCAGLSLSRPLPLRSTGSRRAGSVVVAHGLSCPAACGIFPDQGSNPCPLHWQADSQPLRHQGSPKSVTFNKRAGLALPSMLAPPPKYRFEALHCSRDLPSELTSESSEKNLSPSFIITSRFRANLLTLRLRAPHENLASLASI